MRVSLARIEANQKPPLRFDSLFYARRVGRGECTISVCTRSNAVRSFEVPDEVTVVTTADASDDLLHAEKRGGEQRRCVLQAE